MVWAIIKIYTSKCAQMDPQQLPKSSKLYYKSKKCDIEKTLGGVGTTPPLGSPKVNLGELTTSNVGCKFRWLNMEAVIWNLRGSLKINAQCSCNNNKRMK